MSLWHRLYYWLGLRREHGPRYYELDESLHLTLSTLASREGRTENQLAADLLAAGLTQYYSSDDNWKRWRSLSRREQDMSALACLGYTNRQMAARLGISTETIKTHMHSALIKFNLRSKADLRMASAPRAASTGSTGS
jgi:DNA-binding CsgD family transcriptional regulator